MIAKTFTGTLCCLVVGTLASGTALAQELKVAPGRYAGYVVPYVAKNIDANVNISTNLGPTPTNYYNAIEGGYFVTGPANAIPTSEQWISVPFTPKQNSHAKIIKAAIGYISGVKKVKLGIYSDAAGAVGTLLGGGATATVPDLGVCCTVAQVGLPGAGVALTAGTQYWVVASTDDVNAADFAAAWQASNNANIGGDVAQGGWFTFSALWPAYGVSGTIP